MNKRKTVGESRIHHRRHILLSIRHHKQIQFQHCTINRNFWRLNLSNCYRTQLNLYRTDIIQLQLIIRKYLFSNRREYDEESMLCKSVVILVRYRFTILFTFLFSNAIVNCCVSIDIFFLYSFSLWALYKII